jgi:hypothetical protein
MPVYPRGRLGKGEAVRPLARRYSRERQGVTVVAKNSVIAIRH